MPAEMVVNGERLGKTGKLYWYTDDPKRGEGAPKAECPFILTLESLGCLIEGDEQADSIRITAGNREFVLSSLALYENGNLVMGFAASQYPFRDDTLWLAAEDAQEVLTALGFEQISIDLDEGAMEIRLSAVPGWSK